VTGLARLRSVLLHDGDADAFQRRRREPGQLRLCLGTKRL